MQHVGTVIVRSVVLALVALLLVQALHGVVQAGRTGVRALGGGHGVNADYARVGAQFAAAVPRGSIVYIPRTGRPMWWRNLYEYAVRGGMTPVDSPVRAEVTVLVEVSRSRPPRLVTRWSR